MHDAERYSYGMLRDKVFCFFLWLNVGARTIRLFLARALE